MKLSRLAVDRPVATAMFFLIVVLLGTVSMSRLALDLYPDLELPVAAVVTDYEGAGPVEVEQLVTRPMEEMLGSVENVDSINSQTSAGNSMIMVMFNWGTDMDTASLNMRERLDMLSGFLPDDAGSPMVFQMDPTLMPIMMLSMGGELDQAQLRRLADDEIKNRLERVPGVAQVNVYGGLEREIQVVVDELKLNNYGLNSSQIAQALQSENINMSAGQVQDGQREFLLRTLGEYKSISEIENTIIQSSQGHPIYLRDVAQVVDGYKEQRTFNRLNGEPSLSIDIQKQSDANTVIVADNVHREIERLQRDLPGNVEFGVMFDQSTYIKESINTVATNAIIGGFFAIFILYMFLRNMRSTMIIATAIPISVLATFGLIYFADQTLNLLTMGGLALGVGMMIDSSIVLLENIYRHRQEGYSKIEAAKQGASEVGMAVLASTMTTIVVFLPIVFVQGFASQLFRPMAYVVSFSLFSSLIVAIGLVPMLSSKYMRLKSSEKSGPSHGKRIEALSNRYQRVLKVALRRRKTVVGIVFALLIATFALVPFVGAEFLPAMDAGEMEVRADLDIGTVLDETDELARQLEEVVFAIPEVKTVFTSVGSGGDFFGTGSRPERTTLNIQLVGVTERSRSTAQVVEQVRGELAHIPGAEITVREIDPNTEGMGGGSPIGIEVQGDELSVLEQITDDIAERIAVVEGVREVSTSFETTRPEVHFVIDRQRAASYGISAGQIAQAVRSGVQGQTATQLRMGGEEIDVRVMFEEGVKKDLSRVENLLIPSPSGAMVPVRELAKVEVAEGPISIRRSDNVRIATVSADIFERDLGSIMRDVREVNSDLDVPAGYTVEYGGQDAEMMEAFADLVLALLLAIVLVYMVMASQFESLIHPFIIMFAMPTTFIGIVVSLFITGRALSVPAFIGVILLAGIVVNNAIVLVDYINTLRKRGMERDAAVMQAGKTRLRPILMTASTTILALFPLAIGIGEGAEAQAPMATVVVGGLAFSTLITLVLIPVMYTLLDDASIKVKGWFNRGKKSKAEVEGVTK
ncbi:HAE1 family hydrophobic/amphiphilic exporter-1 [Desulfitispora alkaliphila]|uniref:efflux RND transporter permease subunit n=1 Tax=Desulfitispora alkaliphila TaxID=622674 RepID=UPI003D224528